VKSRVLQEVARGLLDIEVLENPKNAQKWNIRYRKSVAAAVGNVQQAER